jgi:hypothetical protein
MVCGLLYGAAVEEVMNLIVCPSPRFTQKNLTYYMNLIQGLLLHMVVVGLPISFRVKRFAI